MDSLRSKEISELEDYFARSLDAPRRRAHTVAGILNTAETDETADDGDRVQFMVGEDDDNHLSVPVHSGQPTRKITWSPCVTTSSSALPQGHTRNRRDAVKTSRHEWMVPRSITENCSEQQSSGVGWRKPPSFKKLTHESSHPTILVELYEFHEKGVDVTETIDDNEEVEVGWQETARWMKYEEDVEGVDHHFGRPHVASLSFHSLIILRRCITRGTAIFDSEERTFFGVCDEIVTAMLEDQRSDGASDATKEEQKDAIMRILLLRHNHVHDRMFQFVPKNLTHRSLSRQQSTVSRKLSMFPLRKFTMRSVSHPHRLEDAYSHEHIGTDPIVNANGEAPGEAQTEEKLPRNIPSPQRSRRTRPPLARAHTAVPESDEPPHAMDSPRPKRSILARFMSKQSSKDVASLWTSKGSDIEGSHTSVEIGSVYQKRHGSDEDLLKKVPTGSESAQVFVGVLPTLRKIHFGIVRLWDAVYMPELIDAPIPIRFLFFLLGPPISDVDYHEVGRSLSTLISNDSFYETAYNAQSKMDILNSLDDFLDSSIVIPPMKITSKSLLNVHDLQKAIRKRQRRRQELKEKETLVAKEGYESLDGPGKADGFQRDIVKGSKHIATISPPYDPLRRIGLPFYGLCMDLKQRLPYYWSDLTDAANFQCVASLFFMFFAVFAPAIAFGGLLGEKTKNQIGVIETLLAQCICGIIWGVLSTQPLLIMAATGPVLVFEGALYSFTDGQGIEFLPFRVWVSIWLTLIGAFVVMLEGPFLIRFVTRFTEDIFAVLISLIFVYESLKFLVKNFVLYQPVMNLQSYCCKSADFHEVLIDGGFCNGTAPHNYTNSSSPAVDTFCGSDSSSSLHNQPDTALLAAGLLISTFVLSVFLKEIRTSHYFGRTFRKAVGDFGVPIAIVIVGGFNMLLFKEPYLKRLHMPDSLGLTCSGRPLFINPLGFHRLIPLWAIFAAMIPAFLVFILLFVETEITQLLLSKPERGLQKGSGFHWDMMLVSVCTLICSFFGLPWMCAAAVQSLAHVSSLTVMKNHVPGERPKVERVIEQRVTTIGVALLVGGCAFLGFILKNIPIAVLFGVFLYLGVMNMQGVQFLKRIGLFIVPEKYFPDEDYCQKVHIRRMHFYTFIQLLCFIVVWLFKSFKMSALAFPFVMMIICLFRIYVLPRIFTEPELTYLDGEEEKEEDERDDSDLDFYEEAHGIGM